MARACSRGTIYSATMSFHVPFLLCLSLFFLASVHSSYHVQAFSTCYSPRIIPSFRSSATARKQNVLIGRAASSGENDISDTAKQITSRNESKPHVASSAISHHVAIKTRNIENAIKFYSLLGFEVETKFVAGPARAAWLLHQSSSSSSEEQSNNSNSPQSRIELLEVPSYMLNEKEGTIKRAIDLAKREELLGLNHLALDVTNNIPRPDNDDGASADGTACAVYQLQEWMDDLNKLSLDTFGKTLRVALLPTKRIIGKEVYEMAFLYDADGTLVELLNHSGTLQQAVGDGWEPWNGQGFVQ